MKATALQTLIFCAALCSATTTVAAEQVFSLQTATNISSVQTASGVMRDSDTVTPLDHTAQSADIWGRVRNGFAMRDLESPLVDDRMRYYLARPQQLKVMFERGRKYMYHIVSELEKRGMPTELALLPIVESAYNPQALSSAKAAGLWQFIPSTGKDFQLAQNWWVDERRDVVASTDAALKYLQAIYEMHGDWQLALASYNWGENAVARAVANNKAAGKPTDYMSLSMPTETRYYVPKLQALKNIIAHPELYNISLPAIPDQPYFTSIEKRQGMDVALAAKLAEMPLSEFLMLNPGYNRPVMPGSDNARLVLPVENAQKFQENLAHHDAPLVTWKTYSVPRTERIEQVARRLRLAVQEICNANGLGARALLAAGYTLLVPSSAVEVAVETPSKASGGKLRQVSAPTTRTRTTTRSRG
ncbi:transglycosylase SLT domain-containing protein [Uliginosibacterium sp. H3]|uniref:Transglycosylase SLT domain-containing protein n=1 Tax=Uliginosibacterium silvisoli TaxID=3114758 RepID=A0ABU6K511_9RHOO|nr:transglycosylase SLT domain-containing protein [Uliginosibacterium sp. H3]